MTETKMISMRKMKMMPGIAGRPYSQDPSLIKDVYLFFSFKIISNNLFIYPQQDDSLEI